jgi:predicted transglutaminase-like cysteine proteinase
VEKTEFKAGAPFSDMQQENETGFLSSIKAYLNRNRLGELLVQRGTLTPQDLRFALYQQKQSKGQLGQVLIDNNFISKAELGKILFRQKMVRIAATGMICFMTFSSFGPKRAQAASPIKDVAGAISIDGPRAEFSRVSYYPALFGSDEKKSRDLSAFTKWTGMFKRFEASMQTDKGMREMAQMRNELRDLKGLSLDNMAKQVNSVMNAKPYIVDQKNWGKSDYWATPVEFLTRGGDCEDFAIAKYAALRAVGVPEERMRLAIVQDQVKNIPHAILIVYGESGPLFLDNQMKTVGNAATMKRYKPIFSINRTAWWLHSAPTTTRVASAR